MIPCKKKYKIFRGEHASKKNKYHNEKIEGQDKKQPLFKVCGNKHSIFKYKAYNQILYELYIRYLNINNLQSHQEFFLAKLLSFQ